MSNPLIRAFFIGRATADVLLEKLEDSVTDLLSEVGKFEADQREHLREFAEAVLMRAEAEQAEVMRDLGADASVYGYRGGSGSTRSTDLQQTIDELRAEIARLRSELQRYRNRNQAS